jgi:hypothetical protein
VFVVKAEEFDAERKAKAQKRAEELRRLMKGVTVEDWVKDVKETRQEM